MTNLIGCTCSETQLNAVGCECWIKVVSVWPRGYACETGLKTIRVADHAGVDFGAEARKAFGMNAVVASVRDEWTRPIAPVTEAHAREMTKGDNS